MSSDLEILKNSLRDLEEEKRLLDINSYRIQTVKLDIQKIKNTIISYQNNGPNCIRNDYQNINGQRRYGETTNIQQC